MFSKCQWISLMMGVIFSKWRNWIPPCGKNGTHWHLLMLAECFRNQTVDVSTVRQWVVRFGSGDSDMKDKLCYGWPCTAVTPWNEELLFIAVENAQLIVVTMLKNSVCTWEFALPSSVIELFVSVISMGINKEALLLEQPGYPPVLVVISFCWGDTT